MGNTLIKIDSLDQRLIVTSAPTLASGGKNANEVEFNFCEKWDGFKKVAVFYRDIKNPYKSTIDANGRCVVPWEVLISDGYISIGVYGVKDDVVKTSEIVKYKIKLGAITEDLKPSDSTPELWEQILAEITEVIAVGEKVDIAIENFNAFEKNRPFNLTGNPVQVETFEGIPLNPVMVLEPKQEGSGDPYPIGGGKNLINVPDKSGTVTNTYYIDFKLNYVVVAGQSYTISLDIQCNMEPFNMAVGVGDDTGFRADIKSNYNLTSGRVSLTFEPTEAQLSTYNKLWLRIPRYTQPNTFNYSVSKIQLELGSTATGYASPSNIRSISGYDALNLNHAGKNLIPRPYFREGLSGAVYESKGITWTVREDGSIHAKGVATEQSEYVLCGRSGTGLRSVLILPPGSYTLSGWRNISGYTPSSSNVGYIQVSKYDDTEGAGSKYNTKEDTPVVWTCKNSSEIFITIRIKQGIEVDTVFYPQFEIGSATEYKPYQGKMHTVQIGQTVYSGRYDWLTGRLTADIGFKTLTGNETYTAASNGIVTTISDAAEPIVGGIEAWCSHYKRTNAASVSSIADGEFAVSHKSVSGTARLYIRDSVNCPDISTGQAYLAAQYAAGTPVQIAYELAEPIEIQLESHEVNALQGVNTLYGDGEITISGRSDMQAVVSNLLKRIAMLESKLNESTLSSESE